MCWNFRPEVVGAGEKDVVRLMIVTVAATTESLTRALGKHCVCVISFDFHKSPGG